LPTVYASVICGSTQAPSRRAAGHARRSTAERLDDAAESGRKWGIGMVGSSVNRRSAKLASTVRDKLRELFDGFIKEYVAANPKR
jgi:hypothetical protein